MSRQINQPVQSIKLTNVATVRLTVQGKRFEVACYKNKVLDYRAGLETDLSEVLQSHHIFTSVAQGQFAAAADLQACFGPTTTTEEIAIQILQRGKSLQVGSAERAQQYEQTLAQIATWLASHCHHPVTGKPYTVSQIRQALTTTSTNTANAESSSSTTTANSNTSNGGGGKKKKKNKNNNNKSNTQQEPPNPPPQFTVQPHKPIKQQYLAALKYLQTAHILPIQRAAMRLQWEYPVEQHDTVTQALLDLHIPPTGGVVVDATANSTTKIMILTVDPALYRPLHELATTKVPGSNLEILQQQVFPSAAAAQQQQQHPRATTKTTTTTTTVPQTTTITAVGVSKPSLPSRESTEKEDDDDDDKHDAFSSSSSSDDEDTARQLLHTTRPNQRRAKNKKQSKKAQQLVESSSSSSSSEDEAAVVASPPSTSDSTTTTPPSFSAPPPSQPVQTCNTCVGAANAFATPAAYRAHFRSDWHRYNQKLKLQGAPAIALEEFQQCDAEAFFAKMDVND